MHYHTQTIFIAIKTSINVSNSGRPSTLVDRYANVIESVNAAHKTKFFSFL